MTMSTEQQNQSDRTDAAIKAVADSLRDYVAEIEASIKTTQNHYGRYMSILSIAGGDATAKRTMAFALIEAGANKPGVYDALRAHGVEL